jgi:hypothetical protein
VATTDIVPAPPFVLRPSAMHGLCMQHRVIWRASSTAIERTHLVNGAAPLATTGECWSISSNSVGRRRAAVGALPGLDGGRGTASLGPTPPPVGAA